VDEAKAKAIARKVRPRGDPLSHVVQIHEVLPSEELWVDLDHLIA